VSPKAAADTLRAVGMNLKGMALALDALQHVQVEQSCQTLSPKPYALRPRP